MHYAPTFLPQSSLTRVKASFYSTLRVGKWFGGMVQSDKIPIWSIRIMNGIAKTRIGLSIKMDNFRVLSVFFLVCFCLSYGRTTKTENSAD